MKFATKLPLARHQNKLLLFFGGDPAGLWHQSTLTRYPWLVHKLVDVLWCRLYVTSTLPFMLKQHVGEGDEPGFVCVLPKAEYRHCNLPRGIKLHLFLQGGRSPEAIQWLIGSSDSWGRNPMPVGVGEKRTSASPLVGWPRSARVQWQPAAHHSVRAPEPFRFLFWCENHHGSWCAFF